MSPAGWARRLSKRGLRVHFFEHGFGYAGDCELTEWTVFVEPTDLSRHDARFPPLIGVGRHLSLDQAAKCAVVHLDEVELALRREQVVLALAGETAP